MRFTPKTSSASTAPAMWLSVAVTIVADGIEANNGAAFPHSQAVFTVNPASTTQPSARIADPPPSRFNAPYTIPAVATPDNPP